MFSTITAATTLIAIGLCAIWGLPAEWALTAALIGFTSTFVLAAARK